MFGKNFKSEVTEATKDIDFASKQYQVMFETNKGNIRLNLFQDLAPEHCKNLIGLAKIGFYNNLTFHRIIEGFVIQGGCPEGNGTGGPGYNLKAEFNETPHKAGVLSMARAGHPDTAGSQFFVCLGNVPYLDKQYTAFGQTADEESLKTVLDIGAMETGADDRPVEEVKITSAYVVEAGA